MERQTLPNYYKSDLLVFDSIKTMR